MEEQMFWVLVSGLLLMVILFLLIMIYAGIYGMARIYNWNGKRYCYLGYVPIRKEAGSFVVQIGEHMVDLSYTTAYLICPSKVFCRKNRYRDMFVYADRCRKHLVVDREPMKTEIPF